MVIVIMESLEMVRKMVKVFILILIEMFIEVNGMMIKNMELENIPIIQVRNFIKENGKIIRKMDKVNIYLIMVINILVHL